MRLRYQSGEVQVVGRLPEPPEEWGAFRRENMVAAIEAAHLFIVKGLSADQVAKAIQRPGVTKSRVGQLVRKGMEFLLDRGYLTEA